MVKLGVAGIETTGFFFLFNGRSVCWLVCDCNISILDNESNDFGMCVLGVKCSCAFLLVFIYSFAGFHRLFSLFCNL